MIVFKIRSQGEGGGQGNVLEKRGLFKDPLFHKAKIKRGFYKIHSFNRQKRGLFNRPLFHKAKRGTFHCRLIQQQQPLQHPRRNNNNDHVSIHKNNKHFNIHNHFIVNINNNYINIERARPTSAISRKTYL